MSERKCHDPVGLAREYMVLGAEGTVCPHGVDRFERRLSLLVNFPEWICRCCCHRFQDMGDGMPEGGLCRDCSPDEPASA